MANVVWNVRQIFRRPHRHTPEQIFFHLCLWVAVATDSGRITCSISPVAPLQDTVLTCSFPEDVSVSKKDFTVYHYTESDRPDAVVDCWWMKGMLDCFTRPGFSYNRSLSRILSVTISRVDSALSGTYSCQVAGYRPNLIETCQLQFKFGSNNTCSISIKGSDTHASLTCFFTEDVRKTQKDFAVYKHIQRGNEVLQPTRVVECTWEEGRPRCEVENGYLYDHEASAYITVQIPHPTTAERSVYTCWHAGSQNDQQEPCYLPFSDPEELKTSRANTLLYLLLVPVVAAVLVVVWIRRRIPRLRRRAQGPGRSGGDGQKLLERIDDRVTTDFKEYLQDTIRETYKDMLDTFYLVPPVYFNKTRYKPMSVEGEVVYVLDPTDRYDVRHDRAMQHVMHCLRHMAEGGQEPMFILTQFQYEDYLNNPWKDFASHRLPMPAGLREVDKRTKSFDFLVVHRHKGMLVGVVTAVSDEDRDSDNDTKENYAAVVREVSESIHRLKKADKMLKHLLSDHSTIPTVRQTVVLPNISSSSLRNAISSDSSVVRNLRECLGVNALDDPTVLCLCAENMSDPSTPWDVSSDVSKVRQWFKRLTTGTPGDTGWSDDLYVSTIARFVGPATVSTLEIQDDRNPVALPKTLREAVSLTGQLFELPVMYPEMVKLLKSPRLYLCGPPNSCKTRMLALAGRKWLSSGFDLFVVNDVSSKTDSFLAEHLQELTTSYAQSNAKSTYGCVYTELSELNQKKKAREVMQKIIDKAREKTPSVLVNDVQLDRQIFNVFLKPLLNQLPNLYVWISSCRDFACLEGLFEKFSTACLNTPPAVLREVQSADAVCPMTANFQTAEDYPPRTDGPPVKFIRHEKSILPWRPSPHDCPECGQKAGDFLKKTLLVDEFQLETHTNKAASQMKCNVDQRSSLQSRDVLIVFESDLTEDNQFLKGLRESGVTVPSAKSEKDKVVATDDSNSAQAMHVRHMQTYRTQRKIVVYVETDSQSKYVENKQRALTICSSQLILVR